MKRTRVQTQAGFDGTANSLWPRPGAALWNVALAMLGMWMLLGAGMASAQMIFKDGFETRPLNDSGIVWSGDYPSGNAAICDSSHPAGQDCHFGRDAEAAAGTLQKIGASATNNGIENGFDYTKISNSGNVLPASAPLGNGPNDWACTRDNVTGLIWEVKTNSGGMRDQSHTYSWYNPNSPDGNPGTEDGGSCYAAGRCDTEKYVADVNVEGLCGHSDWRMPSARELLSIADRGRHNPSIDPLYFPNTPSSYFWSASPRAFSSYLAWNVYFNNGVSLGGDRSLDKHVRLVRGGQ